MPRRQSGTYRTDRLPGGRFHAWRWRISPPNVLRGQRRLHRREGTETWLGAVRRTGPRDPRLPDGIVQDVFRNGSDLAAAVPLREADDLLLEADRPDRGSETPDLAAGRPDLAAEAPEHAR